MNTPFFNPSLDQDLNSEQIANLDLICQEVTSKFFNQHYTEVIMNTLSIAVVAVVTPQILEVSILSISQSNGSAIMRIM